MTTPVDVYPKVGATLDLRGKHLRSRLFLPGHQPGLADDGLPGDRYIAYHRQRARAGLGMQITGATPIIWSDVWADGLTLVNIDERIIPGYRCLAAAVHDEGGVILAQLAHVGAMETTGDGIISASDARSQITQRTAREASVEELSEVIDLYRAAALRCQAGELDGVEITMAHGMLLASFLSPLMNRREDQYGGGTDERTLFPRQVLAAIRQAIGPRAIIGVRLPGDELVPGGIDANEAAAIAKYLSQTGEVDYINVTAGNNTFKLARVDHWPPTPAPFGAFRHLARAVRAAVDVPVATVGRVTTLRLAEDILAAGDADLVGMVRAHIADAELLPKSRAGKAKEVRPCIGANVCVNSLLDHQPLTCLANPDVGRPHMAASFPRGHGKKAVIVGAGPAGLEAARRLASNGWSTVLIEREKAIGGQMARWLQTPSRREFQRLIDWWAREIKRCQVETRFGCAATAADLIGEAADLIVLATGSDPIVTPVPQKGTAIAQIGPYDQLPPGGHVLVRDEMGGLAGLLTAERASLSAARVTYVTSLTHPGEGDGLTTVYPLIRDCAGRGIALIDRAVVAGIEGSEVRLQGVFGEARPTINNVDVVISVLNCRARAGLAGPLAEQGMRLVVIGDARLPRDVTAAVADAARLVEAAARDVVDRETGRGAHAAQLVRT